MTRFFSLAALLLAAAGFSACSSDSDTLIDQPEVTKQASYEAVDLGITVNGKKILWANKNVGADSETDYGDYFAFGATEPLYSKKPTTNGYLSFETGYEAGYVWANTPYYTGNGNNKHSWRKYPNANDVLDPSDDAAHVNMGGDWYMPTHEEWKALTDNCTSEWTTVNGVNGCRFTSIVAGYTDKSIFLPAAGYCYGTRLTAVVYYGYYWSATVDSSSTNWGWYLWFDNSVSGYPDGSGYRYLGLTVRGVIRK